MIVFVYGLDAIASGTANSAYVAYCTPLCHRTAASANTFDSDQGIVTWQCCLPMFTADLRVVASVSPRGHSSSFQYLSVMQPECVTSESAVTTNKPYSERPVPLAA